MVFVILWGISDLRLGIVLVRLLRARLRKLVKEKRAIQPFSIGLGFIFMLFATITLIRLLSINGVI